MIIWEVLINLKINLNTAIVYCFTGRFDLAKDVLDKRLMLIYAGVYIFAIWDSYRLATDLNKFSVLADREKSPIIPFKISSMSVNYFDKRNPWVSVVWSIFVPGTGHLYLHRLPTGFFVLIWWITISYLSHLYEAIHYTAVGAFSHATAVVDPQWLLFLPSIYGFAIYDAYTHTVEYNKLFEREQARFLSDNYQNTDFVMPV